MRLRRTRLILSVFCCGIFAGCISLPLPGGSGEGLAAGKVERGFDLKIFFRDQAGGTFLASTQGGGWLLCRLQEGDYTIIRLSLEVRETGKKINLPMDLPVRVNGGAVNNLGVITPRGSNRDDIDFLVEYEGLRSAFGEFFGKTPWDNCQWTETAFYAKAPAPVSTIVQVHEKPDLANPLRQAEDLEAEAATLEAEAGRLEEEAGLLRAEAGRLRADALKLRGAISGQDEPEEETESERPPPTPSSAPAAAPPPPPLPPQPKPPPPANIPLPVGPPPEVGNSRGGPSR
jgi:hypothetical protein